MHVYINGRFVPEENARVSVFDHGFMYGDGVYETLRVYGGNVFLLNEHLKRLSHSARGIGLRLPLSLKGIAAAVRKTAAVNRLREAVIRLTLSRGPGPYGFDPRPCKTPTLVIFSFPFQPYPPLFHEKGVRIALVSIRRNSPLSLPPHVKSCNCLNGILAKKESLDSKAQEGVFLTLEGFLSEGTVSNIFVVYRGRVLTPALDGHLLAGVTRDRVCRLARNAGWPVFEKKVSLRTLLKADEIFLTNTTMEILPVREAVLSPGLMKQMPTIRTKRWRQPNGNPVTRELMGLFREALKKEFR